MRLRKILYIYILSALFRPMKIIEREHTMVVIIHCARLYPIPLRTYFNVDVATDAMIVIAATFIAGVIVLTI